LIFGIEVSGGDRGEGGKEIGAREKGWTGDAGEGVFLFIGRKGGGFVVKALAEGPM
jgi:hypothetical protein